MRCKKAVDAAFTKHIFEADTQLSGVTAQPAATEDYMHAMQRLGHSGLEIFRVGLCVHPDHEYIAASPDRLVFDPASVPRVHGLFEIKCPLIDTIPAGPHTPRSLQTS